MYYISVKELARILSTRALKLGEVEFNHPTETRAIIKGVQDILNEIIVRFEEYTDREKNA